MRAESIWDVLFPPKREEAFREYVPQTPGAGNTSNNASSTSNYPNNSLVVELEEAWKYVQEHLHCYDYELPFPEIKEDAHTNTACIDMTNHKITINKRFLDYLLSKGMDYQTALRGILSHEAGHYKIMPWDLENLILMQYTARKVCTDKEKVITNYFTDVSLNLYLMLNKRNDEIHQLYRHLDKNSKIDNLLSHLYTLKTGYDFNSPKLPDKLKTHLTELGKLNFTKELDKFRFKRKKRVYAKLIKFANIIKDLVNEEQRDRGLRDNENSKGGGNGKYSLSDIDNFGIGAYNKDEIRRALKGLAKKLSSPTDYRELYNFVKEAQEQGDKNKGNGKNNNGLGMGKGTRQITSKEPDVELEALVEFYTTKSETYDIHIKPKHTPGRGSKLIKTELKSWEAQDPYLDIDPFNSYGKFFPNITKSWNYSSTDYGTKKSKSIPELLLMIDSSASMTEPAKRKSNAVLGAICAARQYLRKGSKVAVVNFSTLTKAYTFSDDYRKIAERIIQYQGGGTMLASKIINKLVSSTKKEVDIMLITDGGIWNLDNVMQKLYEKKNTNRITILHIPFWCSLSDYYKGGFGHDKDKITVYNIMSKQDIPKIVIDDMKKGGVI